jgi:hypothetical protein
MAVNKFNIHWQIVRTKARDIKDPKAKLKYVLSFLDDNKNAHNFGRVLNWVQMTAVSYKGDVREMFEKAATDLKERSSDYSDTKDMPNDLNNVPWADVEKVYADLSKRMYGFQYKTTPKAHIEFMDVLKKHLGK